MGLRGGSWDAAAGPAGAGNRPLLEALKLVLAGASVAMLASELLQHGIDRLRTIRDELAYWLDELGHESVAAARGTLSQAAVPYPAAFERGQYFRVAADPRSRPSAEPGVQRPVWQTGEAALRGHLSPAAHAEPGRRPPPTADHTAAPPGGTESRGGLSDED